jgi:hypothetical protein
MLRIRRRAGLCGRANRACAPAAAARPLRPRSVSACRRATGNSTSGPPTGDDLAADGAAARRRFNSSEDGRAVLEYRPEIALHRRWQGIEFTKIHLPGCCGRPGCVQASHQFSGSARPAEFAPRHRTGQRQQEAGQYRERRVQHPCTPPGASSNPAGHFICLSRSPLPAVDAVWRAPRLLHSPAATESAQIRCAR